MLKTYSDQQLIDALNEGSAEAFDILFETYWYKAYRTAYEKVKSRETAKEITQDFFMSLWDKRGNLAINNFSHYLKSSIKYRAIDFIRARIVQEKYWGYYKIFIPQNENSTEKIVAFNELVDTIEKGMIGVPEKSRKIFYLNRLEGKSVKEIAHIFHLSEKAIEYHLTRTLKVLRVHLKDFILILAGLLFGIKP